MYRPTVHPHTYTRDHSGRRPSHYNDSGSIGGPPVRGNIISKNSPCVGATYMYPLSLCRPVLCSTLSSVSDRVLVSPRSAPNCVNLRHTHEGAATHQDTKDRALPWHYATLSTSHVSAQSNPQTVVVHDVDRRTIFAYIAVHSIAAALPATLHH